NFIPKDSWDRDFRVEINTTKAGSRSGVNGETAVDVYIGEYYLTIRSGGPDKKFGTQDDITQSEYHKSF
ncbi:MAG: hypothetical protein PHW04_19205, partial [Candidatus Wallbacteria bacterium]|nr:hypothetical protein [Candidatus Wallbacteria bacterium]